MRQYYMAQERCFFFFLHKAGYEPSILGFECSLGQQDRKTWRRNWQIQTCLDCDIISCNILEFYSKRSYTIQRLCGGIEKVNLTLPGTVFYRKRAKTLFSVSVYHRLHLALHLNNPLASAFKNIQLRSFSLLAILRNIVQNAVIVLSSVFFIFSLLGPWIENSRMGSNGKL